MIKYLTYEYRIYPTKSQKELINLTFFMCRYMYNTLLRLKTDLYHKFISYSNWCQKYSINLDEKVFSKKFKLTKMSLLKKVDSRYKKVDSLALCAELSHLNRAFENYFSGRANFPKYKKRKDKNSYTTSNVNNNIRIEGRKIRLPKVGFVKAVLHRKLPCNCVIKRAVIKEDKLGKYYVSLVLEIETKETSAPQNNVVGLDFKVGEIFVSSENDIPKFSRPYRLALNKLREYEKKLKIKEKFSKNYWRLVKIIRKLHQKVRNKRRDFLHKLSKKIVDKFGYIGVESISLVEIAKKLSTGINVYETGFSNFVEMLIYKSFESVIFVDRWFPSSKMCSRCSNIKHDLKLEDRVYTCNNCGLVIDRDFNAAINIRNEATRMLNSM